MKKTIIAILSLFTVFTLCACAKEPAKPKANASDSPNLPVKYENVEVKWESSWANWSDAEKIYSKADNKARFQEEGSRHAPLYVIDSLSALEGFKKDFQDVFTLDQGWDEIQSVKDMTKKCDEAYFKDNILLLVYVETSSTTPRYGVSHAVKGGDRLSVYIECTYSPELCDDAMGGWLFGITVSKKDTAGIKDYDAQWK